MQKQNNNFDLLRLIAAMMVFISHQYSIITHVDINFGPHNLGNIGVFIFFSISGYLISESWKRGPDFQIFAWKRFLRIVPALFVLSAITFPLFYYKSILPIDIGSPLNNPSLWTIKYEVVCYAAIAAMGVSGLITLRWLPALMATAMAAYFYFIFGGTASRYTYTPLGFNKHIYAMFMFGAFFLSGMTWNHYKEFLTNKIVGFAIIGLCLVSWLKLEQSIILLLAVPYLTCLIGKSRQLISFDKIGDMSYGFYIWASPVQYTIYYLLKDSIGTWAISCLSFAVALIIAYCSWHMIEKPALKLKHRFFTKSYTKTPNHQQITSNT